MRFFSPGSAYESPPVRHHPPPPLRTFHASSRFATRAASALGKSASSGALPSRPLSISRPFAPHGTLGRHRGQPWQHARDSLSAATLRAANVPERLSARPSPAKRAAKPERPGTRDSQRAALAKQLSPVVGCGGQEAHGRLPLARFSTAPTRAVKKSGREDPGPRHENRPEAQEPLACCNHWSQQSDSNR